MKIDFKTTTGRDALPVRKAPYSEKIAKGVFLLFYVSMAVSAADLIWTKSNVARMRDAWPDRTVTTLESPIP